MSPSGPGRLFKSFSRNQDGNVGLILALSTVPLILLVGASVDYTRAVTKKTTLQQATDATVLAVAHYLTQNMTSAQLSTQTRNYFAAAVNDPNAWIVSGPTVSADNTQVCMVTRNTLPTTIMRAAAGAGLTASNSITVVADSCAKINNMTYEVAMVLDNSGSMLESTSGTTKIASLQTAATQLVNIMNPAGQTPKTAISLVPFSLAVNVGSKYRGASWIDNTGQSSISMQNFRLPKGLSQTAFAPNNKFALFDAMGQSWGGCLEERPGSYLASDAPATASNPDSLYVPYLNPDEYSNSNNSQLISRYGYTTINNYLVSDRGGQCQSGDLYTQADTPGSTTPLLIDDGNPNLPYNISTSRTPMGDTQTMVCKYKPKAPMSTSSSSFFKSYSYNGQSGFETGPNLLCDSQAMTTLTNDNSALVAQINAMYAKGSTNLFSGVMWGWHTLSPNWSLSTLPTPSGVVGPQAPQAYNAPNNVKVMVLMTDGYNSWNALSTGSGSTSDRPSTYSPFGYFDNSRLGSTNSSNWRSVMDSATLQACNNAKAAGIQIYTVGFSIPSDPIDASGLSLLQSCATKTSMAYIAQDGSALVAAFQEIGNQMSGLRLTN